MKTLQISRIKPNPTGKDRSRYGVATPSQLGAEWVDIQNVGGASVILDGVELNHIAYSGPEKKPTWEAVCKLTGSLGASQILRVHSGEQRPLLVLNAEDLAGADWHGFTGRDQYVWNNREGDTPALWDFLQSHWIDRASYSPNPPEGVVLVRVGDALIVPIPVAAYSRR